MKDGHLHGKKSVNAVIGVAEILFNPRFIKSLNSVETIQPRMMCTSFDDKPFSKIVSCCSPINSSYETAMITFYN